MKRLLLLAFIWGWSFMFIKVAVGGMTPATVAFSRIALGAVVLHLVVRARTATLPRDLATWRRFFVVAAFGSAVPFTMIAWGEERITSALTAVLNASTPIFTALAAAALLRDRLRPVHGAGLVMGFVGVGVASGIGGGDLDGASLAGSLAAVGAGACYGIAFVYTRKHLVGMPPEVAACGQLTAGAVMLAPLAITTSAVSGLDLDLRIVGSVVLLGAVGTGAAYVLNYSIIREVGATKASLVTYLIPAVAVSVGVVVLREPFHLSLLVGGALIIGGIAIVHDRLRWPRPPRPPVGATALVVVVALAAGSLAACGNNEGAACGPVRREALDPGYLVHVLADGPDLQYRSDPPTSGPHQPGPAVEGLVDEPLPRPVQVGLLEQGDVLLQHRSDLAAADRTALAALAGDGVVVAPNPDLDHDVVATAWLHKQTCTSIDVDALSAFIDDRRGHGPQH